MSTTPPESGPEGVPPEGSVPPTPPPPSDGGYAPPPPPPGNPYGQANAYSEPATPMRPADEKMWAILIHVLGIFFSFIPALIGYLVLKDRGPFVAAHTKTALNFQLTMLIAYIVGIILSIVIIGAFISLAAWVLIIIFSIIAAMKANQGEFYTYPLSIKFVK